MMCLQQFMRNGASFYKQETTEASDNTGCKHMHREEDNISLINLHISKPGNVQLIIK